MTPTMALFETGINMLQCALTIYFGTSVFTSKRIVKYDALYVIPFWLLASAMLSTFTFCEMPDYIPDILPSVAVFLLLTILFRKGTTRSKVIWCIMHFGLCGALTYFMQILAIKFFRIPASALSGQGTARVIYVMAVNAALIAGTMLLIRIARHIMRRSEGNELDYCALIVFTMLPIASLAILLSMMHAVIYIPYEVIPTLKLEMSAFAILVANGMVLLLFDRMTKQNVEMVNLTVEKLKIETQLYHYDDLEKAHKSVQAWQHDRDKHLNTMRSLLEMGEKEKLHEYISSLTTSSDLRHVSYATGNLVMDAILSSIGNMLHEEKTRFIVKMRLSDKLPISDRDLTIIMWNLLENARDACMRIENTEERFVQVAGLYSAKSLELQVVNSMRPAEKKKGIWGLTSKRDPKKHGMGLHIVSQAVEKYEGFISFKENDNLHETNAGQRFPNDRACSKVSVNKSLQ